MKELTDRLGDRMGIPSGLRSNPEFQSALVRITASVFGAIYIGLGAWTEYYRIHVPFYLTLFPLYLLLSVGILYSVTRRPEWPVRRYLALCLDIFAVSLAIFITQDAISPFYLLYILIFISAGTRFGKEPLVVASVVAVIAYNLVLLELDEWQRHTFEAAFFLLLLVLLPLYQASLLRQVQQAREDAVRANQAKGDFLAFMTHELRTPLTGVIGMTELLKGTRLDEEQRDYVQAIDHSANSLGALIGDILDFSKIDARKLTLESIPFNPRELVRDACGILQGRALEGELELLCEVRPEVPTQVLGDQLRVRQILLNLLSNAIKFTERGQVSVRLSVRPPEANLSSSHLLLEVADTGIGIPKDKLESLFESFRQADDSTTRRYGGSGLGTTIARQLTLLMGGSIGVESEEGEGSRFWARLPLLDESSQRPSAESSGRLRGLTALVVERNPAQRALIGEVLVRQEMRCHALTEPAAVNDLELGRGAPDLLLIADHPAGLDLHAAVREIEVRLRELPPCLLLTHAGRRPKTGLPGVAHLNKPFLPEDLVTAVERLLGRVPSDGASRPSDLDARVPGPTDQRPRPEIRVLVAEDNEIAARVITSFLTKMGFAPTRFRDGETALAAALGGGYQIAIVDLRMPKLDGVGFTRRYRAAAPDRPLPIVALTANAAGEVKQACLDAGMNGFLAKPVTPEELRRALDGLGRVPDLAAVPPPAPGG